MYRTQYIYVQWFENNINSSRSWAYIIGYKVLYVMVHIIKKIIIHTLNWIQIYMHVSIALPLFYTKLRFYYGKAITG